MNLEDKTRFFAQYWGQPNILIIPSENNPEQNNPEGRYDVEELETIDVDSYLELTPLSSITDEHAIEVAKTIGWDESEEPKHEAIKFVKTHFLLETELELDMGTHCAIADCLRKYGYALPFDGINVEKQIELGWTKLKEPIVIDISGTKGYKI